MVKTANGHKPRFFSDGEGLRGRGYYFGGFMKTLAIIGLAMAWSVLVAAPAFPLSYEIDVGQDGIFETGVGSNCCGQAGVPIDIYVDGYTCPPDDKLFGVQTYISIDESQVGVTACEPLAASGCDPVLSGCTNMEENVYSLICSNLNFIILTGSSLHFGTLTVDCVGDGVTNIVVADDLTAYGYPAYSDGFLSDCNLESIRPTDGVLPFENIGAPCACYISPGDPVTIHAPDSLQFTADDFGCCELPSMYLWSDTCEYGSVDQEGLITADATCVGETCEVCVLDTANSDLYNTIEDCVDVEIMPLVPCYADCNGDKKVDLADLVIMKGEFLRDDCATNSCQADCNGDDKVDLADLVIMKDQFLRTGCPVCP